MAQFLKEQVQQRIVASALRVFAAKGYVAATMSEIAEGAAISTGNIYRYYETKEALFDDAVDDKFVRTFTALLHARVGALAGIDTPLRELPPGAEWFKASEELLRFTIDNRLRVVVLFGRSKGTRLDGFLERTVDDLVRFAIAHVMHTQKVRPTKLRVDDALRFTLTRIYENLIATTARILAEYEDEGVIRERTRLYSQYHLGGLDALFSNSLASVS